jgi:hypothetical protein
MVLSVYGVGQLDVGERQVPARVVERATSTRDGERLTRRATDEHVAQRRVFDERGEVAVKRDVRITVRENGARERFDLREADGLPSKWLPSDGRGLDTRANGKVLHLLSCLGSWSSRAKALAFSMKSSATRSRESRVSA